MPKMSNESLAVAGTSPRRFGSGTSSRRLHRVIQKIVTVAAGSALRVLRKLKRSTVVRRYLYSLENSDEFSRLVSHEIMLADRERVNKYKAAIDRLVRPEDVVVDLGTGTGILALMAARRGAHRVHAIDQTAVIELARHVADCNGIRNVRFHRVHSRDFAPDERVSVILHEQIGDFLIDEDMIANVCELRDRILAPGGRILPARFQAFLEPVSLNKGSAAPLLWEQHIHGINFDCTREWLRKHPEFETRSARSMLPGQVKEFLCEQAPAYEVDLEKVAPDYVPGHIRFTRMIVREGEFAGFAKYFKIDFGHGISLANNPFEDKRAHSLLHWAPMLFPVDRIPVKPGDQVDVSWDIDAPTKPNSWKLEWRVNRDDKEIAVSYGYALRQ